jgi:hypothetical protein
MVDLLEVRGRGEVKGERERREKKVRRGWREEEMIISGTGWVLE